MAGQIAKVTTLTPRVAERYTTQQVADALTRAKGLVTVAARELGCSRQCVQNYINRHPTVRAAKDDAREGILDLAEARLFEAINRGEPWAISSTLRTIGKDRGYVERAEVDHSGSIGTYHVNIGEPDDSDT